MSIFVAELFPDGIVFAADKNLTLSLTDAKGQIVSEVQDLGSKILRWPHSRGLLGYVGCAEVMGQPMYDWLYDFMGDHNCFTDPRIVAEDMRDRLQAALGPSARATIIQFAAFARRDGYITPEFWHITNILSMTGAEYDPPSTTFAASERLLGVHLKGHTSPKEIRDYLQQRADAFAPFWFHQGIDLKVFNIVSEAVRQAFLVLQADGHLNRPQTLEEWERYVRMWVLIYGAYYEAFGEPGQRYVGGGADALSIPWPSTL